MNIVIFAHPHFLGSQSMPRFAKMLADGLEERGHSVALWSPRAICFNWPAPSFLKKWLGYIDQYIMFPFQVNARLKNCPANTLFVFADHALGPWVPLVSSRPHVIHCHDLLAQQSAKGMIPENRTGWSGRLYQAYIRKGYQQGKNFISVSDNTREDLHTFLAEQPQLSTVVYNGLNPSFVPGDKENARALLSSKTGIDLSRGFLLHVGGNQWYKNRVGVVEIYNSWRSVSQQALPLLMVGAHPDKPLQAQYNDSPYRSDIHFLPGWDDKAVVLAYQAASVFLFPSLAEGFGWPIAEAMACGCPVITTGVAPMNEVGEDAAFYISRRPSTQALVHQWSIQAAHTVARILAFTPAELQQWQQAGLSNIARFKSGQTMDAIVAIYHQVLAGYKGELQPGREVHAAC